MKTENKIIEMFLEEKKAMTIREISKSIGSDYRIVYTATQRLIKKKVLTAKKVGKSTLCELNNSYYGIEIYEAENKRREEIFKNKDVKQLYKEVMGKLRTSMFIFLLFGSYAKRKQSKNSDLDLMFISNGKNFEEEVLSVLTLLPLKTHTFVFTEEEFLRMKDSRKANVVKEALKNNIILYGIENYYRLKNAE